jgi:hypothetical protein
MISGLYVTYHEKSSGRVSSAIPLLTPIGDQKVKKKSPAGVLKKGTRRALDLKLLPNFLFAL